MLSPSAAATRTGPASATRSTRCCGAAPARASRPGTAASLGAGRPGWHIECAVIALDRLGDDDRRAGRRQRPALPAPRVFGRARRGAHRRGAVRPPLRARRHDRAGRREDVQVARATWCFVSRLRGDGVDPMAIRLALLSRPLPGRPAVDRRRAQGRPAAAVDAGARPRPWPGRPVRRRPAGRACGRALADDLDTPRALPLWTPGPTSALAGDRTDRGGAGPDGRRPSTRCWASSSGCRAGARPVPAVTDPGSSPWTSTARCCAPTAACPSAPGAR